MNTPLWMVHDIEDGLVGIYDNFDTAVKKYEEYKVYQDSCVADRGEFEGSERVILAEIKRDYRVVVTEDPIIEEDENGTEYESGGNYAAFKEFVTETKEGNDG